MNNTEMTYATENAVKAYVKSIIARKAPEKVSVFNNPEFGEIRIATDESGEPWFCLADICRVLELRTDGVMPRLKTDGYNRIVVTDSLGRNQEAIFVNEQNLYRVIMRSDKPKAEPFQDWVCGEVLPSIRKTGNYSVRCLTPAQQLLANAQMLVEMEQRQMEQERHQRILESRQSVAESKIEQIETRIRDTSFMSVMGFANIHHLRVGKKELQHLGKLASAWCRKMNIKPEKEKDGRYGYVGKYPMQALKSVFSVEFPDKAAMFSIPTYWG